ncbi:ABC transporter permease [Paenibacillus gansuensis]|uniref:ABC transporter permease n=1 Tax=Paenibacillus gansuensis TaxID=306542 RepID=A0ABW5PFC6_9BACL
MQASKAGFLRRWLGQWQIQLMALCGIAFILVFCYLPMIGIVMSFKLMDYSYNLTKDFFIAPWVGLQYYLEFFNDYQFVDILKNTLFMNLLQLVFNFPAPILFAILISEVFHTRFKKIVQTITYFPHFLSWIVFGGIVMNLIAQESGVVNPLLMFFGVINEPIDFMGDPNKFWGLVVVTSLLKGLGWGSVIYLAAIMSIDTSLYEAATLDGASRIQRIRHITIPSISGTIIIFFLLSLSNLLNSSFDQIWVFQSPLNLEKSEVIDTYVYKVGLTQMRYSYTTAVGVFKSVIALILLVSGHYISKRLAGRGLF